MIFFSFQPFDLNSSLIYLPIDRSVDRPENNGFYDVFILLEYYDNNQLNLIGVPRI